ncbi:hypothetical protein, partial [Bacteroides thetaiotaomicron]|uniref:hypothetical protein n=1 Tax=Bacteroides thetaiotaomicron TaxID=818 RepID=UPI0020C749A9
SLGNSEMGCYRIMYLSSIYTKRIAERSQLLIRRMISRSAYIHSTQCHKQKYVTPQEDNM